MDHPNSGDLILITEPGYLFRHESDPVTDKPLSPTDTYGMHGYLNHHPAVHASYLALGAGIRKGNAGAFRNSEVAGRVAEWLGIEKPRARPPRRTPGVLSLMPTPWRQRFASWRQALPLSFG